MSSSLVASAHSLMQLRGARYPDSAGSEYNQGPQVSKKNKRVPIKRAVHVVGRQTCRSSEGGLLRYLAGISGRLFHGFGTFCGNSTGDCNPHIEGSNEYMPIPLRTVFRDVASHHITTETAGSLKPRNTNPKCKMPAPCLGLL